MIPVISGLRDVLPSDNLYKLLAIFGLVIMLTGIVLAWSSRRAFIQRLTAAEAEVAWLESGADGIDAELSWIEELVDRIDVTTVARESQQETPGTANARHEDGRAVLTTIAREHLDRVTEKQLEFVSKKSEFSRDVASLRADLTLVRADAIVYFSMAAFGLTASIVGFVLWYKKVQVHMDTQLSRDGKKAAMEIAEMERAENPASEAAA